MLIKPFDSPVDFTTSHVIDNYMFLFENLREICQGGPNVGIFSINEKKISQNEFGGPFLLEEKCVYIPMYSKFSFILVEIDLTNNYTYREIGKHENLIWLKEKKGDYLFYYPSVEKINITSILVK